MRLSWLFLVTAVSPTTMAWAQTSPPPPPPPPPAEASAPADEADPEATPEDEAAAAEAAEAAPPEDEIIVVRAEGDQRSGIDRETYIVRDNAQARTSNALEVLGRIPEVTVQPDNSIRLLGTTGVTVLVDGRPSPNPNVLRDLQATEIARIEVVSNPSAQFSASGTGGIINIITRRTAPGGLRGSATASVSRYGGIELRAAPTWTSGDWTISGNVGWTRNGSESEASRERISLDPASPAPDIFEAIETDGRFEFVNGGGQISYRLNDKKTLTFSGGAVTVDARSISDSLLTTSIAPGAPIAQRNTNAFNYQAYSASLEYRAEGSRPGELLTTSIQQMRFDPQNDLLTEFNGGNFRFFADAFTQSRVFKLDYVRPLATGHRLLVGGSANETQEYARIEQSGDLPLGGNPFPPVSIIDGSYLEGAVYGSYQLPLLGGTLLGGLRVEGRDYQFSDAVQGEGPSDVHFFPSAFFERAIAPWLTGTLSYSRRIAWPVVQQLSPALRFQDSTTAAGGNPDLRPELTDAFEARFRGQVAGQTVALTLFNRRTDDLFSSLNTLTDDGVLVTIPVNVGKRSDLGASVAVQGSLMRGLTYSLNANLIAREVDRDFLGVTSTQSSTTYSATALLDYRDGQDGRRGADRITATFNFSGPYDDGLVERSSFVRASISWSHALTDRLTSIVTVDDLFGPTEYRTETFSDTAITRSVQFSDGPRWKVGLTYSFGRPGQPQPPQTPPAGPMIPIPGGPG